MNQAARLIVACLILHALSANERAIAITITVDYRYDTNNFFNTQQKKDALQAAANRYSALITETLSAATLANNSLDPRIGFNHPGTGASFQVSPATSTANDAVIAAGGPAANEYRGPWSIAANEWILYAGGRALGTSGVGGTGTGTNITTVFDDGNSHLNRGFRASGSVNNLPVWGGAITFDNDGSTVWHFGLNTPAPDGSSDFYSTALHEIGHALGLSTSWLDWTSRSSGGQFSGPATVAAYNADNGTSLSTLAEVSSSNHHWQDGTYDSFVFRNANPSTVGTVPVGVKQDLLMEPIANYTATVKRFELTHVDVGALVDLGWSVVPEIENLPGDFNGNGAVNAADYVVWRKGFGTTYTMADFNQWRANFGETLGSGTSSAVPEPGGSLGCVALILISAWRRSTGRP
jgi:hypothetical protein